MEDENQSVDHQLEAFKEFLSEFRDEGDRAAVILAAAKFEITLRQVLEKVLLPCTSERDDLLDGDAPLSTFSAKIHLVFRLGLIDAPFAKALHQIRKIRNSFAHDLHCKSIGSGPHRDRALELLRVFKRFRAFLAMKNIFIGKDPSLSAEFKGVLAIMAVRLDLLLDTSAPLSSKSPTKLVDERWDEAPEKLQGGKR